MIRIRLGFEGLGRIRICTLPDFDAELTAAGRALARNGRPQDLLTQLYARSVSPDLAEGVSQVYLSHLFARRSATPFTKALAEGEEWARGALADAVDHLRSSAVEPQRSGIRSAVATRSADLSQRYVTAGASAMLRQLGHGIRLRGGVLELPTSFEADLELGPRLLQIQPVALSPHVTLAEPAGDHLTVRIPAGPAPRIERGQDAALRSLLGTGRAAALECIVTSGGVTGQQLASLLGVSNAAASRHAAVLRRAGLIRTLRRGQTVEHVATSLGHRLTQPETPAAR